MVYVWCMGCVLESESVVVWGVESRVEGREVLGSRKRNIYKYHIVAKCEQGTSTLFYCEYFYCIVLYCIVFCS